MRKITIILMTGLITVSSYAHQVNDSLNSTEPSIESGASHRGVVIDWHDDWDDDHRSAKWFVTVGTDVWAKTRVRADVLGISASEKYNDAWSGFTIGAGRQWGGVSLGAYLTAFDIDAARVQNVTLRATLDILPIENLPCVIGELGFAQINSDLLVERAFSYGWGLGWRMQLIEGFFVDITGIYNDARFKFDIVEGIPMRLNANRWTVMMGVGVMF